MAAASKIDLGDIDGIPVAGTTIAIRNAGDGLSKALKVDPKLIHHKETVYVVLECECVDVQFPEIPDANEVMRKHVLKAGVATIVDRKVVIAAMDATREKIQSAKDAETGAAALELEYNPPGEPQVDPDHLADAPEPQRAQAATKAAGAKPPRASRPRKAPAKKATAKKQPAKKADRHLSGVPS